MDERDERTQVPKDSLLMCVLREVSMCFESQVIIYVLAAAVPVTAPVIAFKDILSS